MKTPILVESYEVETIAGLGENLVADAEYQELISKLELKGQEKFSNPDTLERFNYRRVTALERLVFKTLFPKTTKLESYSSGLIPVEILKIAAAAKDSGVCDKGMVVWHPEDVRVDPILIGIQQNPESSWGEFEYLLARWGEALEPFDVLLNKAKELWRNKTLGALKSARSKIENDIASMDEIVNSAFISGQDSSVTYYPLSDKF